MTKRPIRNRPGRPEKDLKRPGIKTVALGEMTPIQMTQAFRDAVLPAMSKKPQPSKAKFISRKPVFEKPTRLPGNFKPAVKNAKSVFDTLRADIPTLMLPVRIETTLNEETSPKRLKIRIFPDQIGIDGLERALTDEERKAGQAFVKKLKSKAVPEDEKKALWANFSAADPWRSAWILRCLTDPAAMQTANVAGKEPFAIAPLLPSRWFVSGYVGDKIVLDEVGLPIPKALRFSPDFARKVQKDNAIALDPALDWMVDFEKSKQVGMALEFDLPKAASKKLDLLIVTGILDKNAEDSATLFARQLESLHYDWGCGFVPQGVATNNTGAGMAGWSARKTDFDALLARETGGDAGFASVSEDQALLPREGLIGDGKNKNNNQQLVRAFGLGAKAISKVFEYAEGDDRSASKAMNTLMWPVTWGEVITTLLQGDDGPAFSDATVEWARNWFCQQVTGGAPLPSVRVGPTPYAILPVQHLEWQEPLKMPVNPQPIDHLNALLNSLLPDWMAASDNLVQITEKREKFTEPGDRLIELLRKGPHPSTFAQTRIASQRGVKNFAFIFQSLPTLDDPNNGLLRDAFTSGELSNYADVRPYYDDFALDAGFAAYGAMPSPLRSGRQQRDALKTQRDGLEAWQALGQEMLDNGSAFAELFAPGIPALTSLIGYFDNLIDLCDAHVSANYVLEEIVSSYAPFYSGVIGEDSKDPPIAFLGYGDNETIDWPESKPKTKAKNAPTPAQYLQNLAQYIRSFLNDQPAPDEPEFPQSGKPLLYQLVRESIRRASYESDLIMPLLERVNVDVTTITPTDQPAKFSAFDATRAREISASIGRLRSGSKITNPTNDDSEVRHFLQAMKPAEVTGLRKTIDAEINAQKDLVDFPIKEMLALSAEIRALEAKPLAVSGGFTPLKLGGYRSRRLNEMLVAVEQLAGLNAAQLELLMTQSLGLAGWRLDAWVTSMAAAEIETRRRKKASAKGLQIGGFGWVQNLEFVTAHEPVKSTGFIHAPSLNHAKTAAILRAGWAAYGGQEDASAFATNLSSNRMRDAKWLFDGVRAGQDLGEMLGAKMERALRDDLAAPEWIYPLRQAVLKLTKQKEDLQNPIVDGLELHVLQEEKNGRDVVLKAAEKVLKELYQEQGLSGSLPANPLARAFDLLDDWVDALTDAALGDSVHALVQGNLLRSGSSVSAIAAGDVPPPELDFLETRPAALTLTHRVGLVAPNSGKSWIDPELSLSPRAFADPDMERLVAAILPEPDKILFRYVEQDGASETSVEKSVTMAVLLEQANIGGALDFLHDLKAVPIAPAGGLAVRICNAIAALTKTKPANIALMSGDTAILDLCFAWRRVILAARPMDTRDIAFMSDTDAQPSIDLKSLVTRAETVREFVVGHIKTLHKYLKTQDGSSSDAFSRQQIAKVQKILAALAQYGLIGPLSRQENHDVIATARSVLPKLLITLKQLAAQKIMTDDSLATQQNARKVLRSVFGDNFAATARFVPGDPAKFDFVTGMSQKTINLSSETPHHWIEKTGYVRAKMRDLNDALMLQDCILPEYGPTIQLAQWPVEKAQSWIAVDKVSRDGGPRYSMISIQPDGSLLDSKSGLAGLIVDEIVDQLPDAKTDAAVAFHFDAPSTEAPQCMLLAVPPKGENWSYELMVNTVRTAFDLALIRGVDGDTMPALNQLLPAIFAPPSLKPGGLS